MQLTKATPILRIFDERKAREFYVDFLGFQVDWEHRFEPDLPLYLQVSRGGFVLHLSEHHGDCCPGAAMRIDTSDIDALHAELAGKRYGYARPQVDQTPWGSREMSVKDPFGNRLTFTALSRPSRSTCPGPAGKDRRGAHAHPCRINAMPGADFPRTGGKRICKQAPLLGRLVPYLQALQCPPSTVIATSIRR